MINDYSSRRKIGLLSGLLKSGSASLRIDVSAASFIQISIACIRRVWLRVREVRLSEKLNLDLCFIFAHVLQSRLHIAAKVGIRKCAHVRPTANHDSNRVEVGVDVEACCSLSFCDIVQ